MIVVDTNVLVYFYLPNALTAQATKLREVDSLWIAPRLWRSELRSALCLYMRKAMLRLDQAIRIQMRDEDLMADCEFEVPSQDVLQLVMESPCSAYDCEFVALAKRFHTTFVTSDKLVLNAFPTIARSLSEAGA